jgi:signal transduction histidine kinase/DNA-binding response OmpR family regulator
MTPLHFLLLEDSLLDAELVQLALAEGGIECEVMQVDTRSGFIQALERDRFDLILSDYALPGFDGISALAVAQGMRPDVPFIIVSGTLGEELAIETLKSGATDYILKQRLGRLVPSVKRALREAQERRDRQQAEMALQQSESYLRFLAEASVILTASLDYKTTLENIARLTVPFLADFCFFDVVTSDKNIQRAAWRHRGTRQDWFDQIQSFVPPQDFTNHPTRRAIATGKALLTPVVTDEWMQTIATRDEHLQFMRELQFQSEIAVPLVIHDRRLGVLTCGFTAESGRHYTETDLRLVEELANRAAIALDNAQLYQQAQEANRVKDEFLAVLSHELRTPLNPILGWSKLLKAKPHDRTTLIRGLDTIERNAKIQTQLIEDLLDVSRILSGKLNLKHQSVSLIPIIESALETVRLSAEAKAIDLTFSFPDNAETLNPQAFQLIGDASRLQQIFWNLFSNAIKFTPTQGQVQIQVTVAQNAIAQIQITDTGKGIPAHFLPYVFDYFRQADGSTTRTFGGLGIGLAIVRHLVELHGGTVHADSPGEGRGSTFTVKLPLKQTVDKPQTPNPVTPPSSTLPLSGLRILLVDDEKDTLDLLTFLLEEAGAIVTPVSSVSAALSALKQANPNLVVSDIGMPNQDGYELLKQLRAAWQIPQGSRYVDIPAIAITAYAREEDRQKVIAAGFQMYLTKPIEPEAVISAITSLSIPRAILNPER